MFACRSPEAFARPACRHSEFAAVSAILRLELFRPDRLFTRQLAVITSLTALMVRYLTVHLVAVDDHAVPPVLNFLFLFWHEHPDIRKPDDKQDSYQAD